MEVQAARDFAEPRKLALVANDLVTVIDHGWVRERRVGLHRVKGKKLLSSTMGLCEDETGV